MIFVQAAGKLWCYPDQAAADQGRFARELEERRAAKPVLTIVPGPTVPLATSPGFTIVPGAAAPPAVEPVEVVDLPARPIPKPDDPQESRRVTKAVRAIDPDALAVKELYTLEEVAVILSMGLSPVERMIREGHLASGKVPGTESARRVSRMQLAAFIAAFDAQNGLTRPPRPPRVKKTRAKS